MDAAGNGIALWAQTQPVGTTSFQQKIVADRFVTTSGWGPPQVVASGAAGDSLFSQDLAVDAAGNAIAAWTTFTGSSAMPTEVVASSRFTPALGWAGVVNVTASVFTAFNPDVAVDGFGRGTIIYGFQSSSSSPGLLVSNRFE